MSFASLQAFVFWQKKRLGPCLYIYYRQFKFTINANSPKYNYTKWFIFWNSEYGQLTQLFIKRVLLNICKVHHATVALLYLSKSPWVKNEKTGYKIKPYLIRKNLRWRRQVIIIRIIIQSSETRPTQLQNNILSGGNIDAMDSDTLHLGQWVGSHSQWQC